MMRTPARTRTTGDWGERLVESRLRRRGVRVLAKNWRCEHGELDLVVQDGATLVVIEVKTRRTRQFGWPEEAVDENKAAHLRVAGQLFVEEMGWEGFWRIDVASVERDDAGRWTIRWIQDAVQG